MATVLAQLSDPHLRSPDEVGAAAALRAAIGCVNGLAQRPDAVLVTGDVGDTGDPAEYAQAAELLGALDAPFHVLPGNHDHAGRLGERFGSGPRTIQAGGLRVVLADSTIPGAHPGAFGPERRAWLAAQLEPPVPTLVALHHLPLMTGVPVMDSLGLPAADRAALGALLAEHPHVLRVACGHVHRATFGVLGGCGVVAAPSTNLSARLDLAAQAFAILREPPAILVHALTDAGELTTHVQPV